MQNFFFSSFISIIFICSIIFVITILFIYYIINKTILSIHNFNIKGNLGNIKNLLIDNKKYNNWWPKFKKFIIYQTSVFQMCDNNLKNARIVITIHSNSSKELWEIILKQIKPDIINITVYQELKLVSKLARILKSSICYKKDLLVFKRSLQKQLSS